MIPSEDFPGGDDHSTFETSGSSGFFSSSRSSPRGGHGDGNERFSRKVFVGGLPPDIDEDEITASFRRFGPLVVDWPHKAESKSYFPPKGYAFLLFQVGAFSLSGQQCAALKPFIHKTGPLCRI